MIEIRQINKSFGKLEVLKSIDLSLQAGRSVALVGPNGSGKTTFMKAILGLVKPDAGDILFDGKSTLKQHDYRKHIGYMPQIGRYPDHVQIGELFEMVQDLRLGEAKDFELVEAYKLKDIFHKPMRTLSGGTRQKVSAALAFMFAPKMYILDEPTAGLDPLASEILKDKIRSETTADKLVLISSHIISDLDELCSEIMYILEGDLLFHKSMSALKSETNQTNLAKALIASLESKSASTNLTTTKV